MNLPFPEKPFSSAVPYAGIVGMGLIAGFSLWLAEHAGKFAYAFDWPRWGQVQEGAYSVAFIGFPRGSMFPEW